MSEIKSLAGLERHALHEVIPLQTPYSVYIFPTNLCNFMCNYCGHSLGLEQMKKEYDICTENMSMETLMRTVDQLANFPDKVKTISMTGHGEPLVNPLLPQMIEYIKKSGVANRIETISNASLLTEEKSIELIESGLDCIRISLQGLSTDKYKKVCNRNIDFDSFVEQIKFFYEHKKGCEVYVKVMDVALDDGEDKAFYNLFDSISDRMYIEQCRPVYSGVESTKDITFTADRYGREHESRMVCPLCFYMLGVHPDGDVAPCETIYKPVTLGNVWQDDIVAMWNGQKNKEFQRMQLEKKRMENPGCARCCAPDDVAHPEDELDHYANELLDRI